MKLIIDIPKEMYNDIKSGKDGYSNYVHTAIRNGTPLPKGHGRLIDSDSLWNAYHDLDYDFYEAFDLAETIIEADKSESEGSK